MKPTPTLPSNGAARNGAPQKEKRSLFRPEAVEYARTQWLGEFRLSTPVSAMMITAFLVGSLAVVLVLLCTLQYTRRVSVAGEFRAEPGIAAIAAPQAGEVQSVFVREGDHVDAGKPLFVVADPHVLDNLSDASTERLRALGRAANAVTTGVVSASTARERQIQLLEAKRESIDGEIATVRSQIAEQRHRVDLSDSILKKYDSLAHQGYISDVTVLSRRDDLDSKQETLESLKLSLLELQTSLADIDAQVTSAQSDGADKQSTAEQQLASIDEQRVETQAGARSLIRAPVSGTVTGVTLNVGQRVEAGSPALSIVPDSSHLVAVLKADGEAAGQAKVGETVLLRVDAFPYQQFGLQRAVVKLVSRSAVAAGQAGGSPSFLMYASPAQQSVTLEGVRYPFRPGMTVNGELLLNRKPLIVWLLGPIGQFFSSIGK